MALRGLFIINPEGVVEQITMNGLSVGRDVDEAKRLVQAIQFVAEHGEVRKECFSVVTTLLANACARYTDAGLVHSVGRIMHNALWCHTLERACLPVSHVQTFLLVWAAQAIS